MNNNVIIINDNNEKCKWKFNMDIVVVWFALKQEFWKSNK